MRLTQSMRWRRHVTQCPELIDSLQGGGTVASMSNVDQSVSKPIIDGSTVTTAPAGGGSTAGEGTSLVVAHNAFSGVLARKSQQDLFATEKARQLSFAGIVR